MPRRSSDRGDPGCIHKHLFFSQGGFYVRCRDCDATWVPLAQPGPGNDRDYYRSQCVTPAVRNDTSYRIRLGIAREEN